ncbi:MAG: lipoprotein-releasing ABC transporter permease subunit [Limibacillus sp.]
MFGVFERMVAWRYLRPRKQEGFISVIAGFSLLGICLGVATLIIVMSVMNGFRQELLGRILGVNGHLTVYSAAGAIENYDSLNVTLENMTGIVQATPQVRGQVMVTGARGGATGALVRGVSKEELLARRIIADNIASGSIEDMEARDGLVVGERLATSLGLRVGDPIKLVSPQGNTTVIGSVPRIKTYRIAALFNVGMYEYDSGFIYMPLEAAQVFFRTPGAVTAIEVFVEDPDSVFINTADIRDTLGSSYRIQDWKQTNASFFNALQVERNVMFLILTLIILVAAFNIISGQIMLVKDKGRDIAILRTMGATRAMILRVFLLSGASIGIFGTVTGLLLGVGFAANIKTIQGWVEDLVGAKVFDPEIYFLTNLPAVIDWTEVTSVVAMALCLSFLATIYPAWRTARLDPVEALRYE